ncbi:hypothetical protein [Micromonospora sp. NPDC050495]|uniref:hypothetical protein n=1 Tax=Micromonospora sp. NPDC050495 TaxID=3154936 RepID=UPI0033D13CA7
MPSRRNTTLKVIKGAKPGGPNPPRRRVVTRAVFRPVEPIEQVLERLDREPVEDPLEGGDLTVIGDPAEVEELPEPRRALRRRNRPVRAVPDPPAGDEAADPPGADEDGGADPPDADAGSDADGPSPRGTGRRSPATPAGPRSGRAVAAVLAVLLAAALAGAGVFGQRWYADRATDRAHREAVAAARQAAVNFVSVSATSVDRDLQRVTAAATGDFKDEFTRGQAQVRTAVVENKVQSQGSVLRAGLVSGDRRHAVVLVAVDATVKNAKAPDGRPSHYRIQLDLVRDRDSGEWLVSKLQFVG